MSLCTFPHLDQFISLSSLQRSCLQLENIRNVTTIPNQMINNFCASEKIVKRSTKTTQHRTNKTIYPFYSTIIPISKQENKYCLINTIPIPSIGINSLIDGAIIIITITHDEKINYPKEKINTILLHEIPFIIIIQFEEQITENSNLQKIFIKIIKFLKKIKNIILQIKDTNWLNKIAIAKDPRYNTQFLLEISPEILDENEISITNSIINDAFEHFSFQMNNINRSVVPNLIFNELPSPRNPIIERNLNFNENQNIWKLNNVKGPILIQITPTNLITSRSEKYLYIARVLFGEIKNSINFSKLNLIGIKSNGEYKIIKNPDGINRIHCFSKFTCNLQWNTIPSGFVFLIKFTHSPFGKYNLCFFADSSIPLYSLPIIKENYYKPRYLKINTSIYDSIHNIISIYDILHSSDSYYASNCLVLHEFLEKNSLQKQIICNLESETVSNNSPTCSINNPDSTYSYIANCYPITDELLMIIKENQNDKSISLWENNILVIYDKFPNLKPNIITISDIIKEKLLSDEIVKFIQSALDWVSEQGIVINSPLSGVVWHLHDIFIDDDAFSCSKGHTITAFQKLLTGSFLLAEPIVTHAIQMIKICIPSHAQNEFQSVVDQYDGLIEDSNLKNEFLICLTVSFSVNNCCLWFEAMKEFDYFWTIVDTYSKLEDVDFEEDKINELRLDKQLQKFKGSEYYLSEVSYRAKSVKSNKFYA